MRLNVCPNTCSRNVLKVAAVMLVLTLSLLVAVPAAWAQEITATLRIEFIEDTRLAPVEVTLEHRPLSEYGFSLPDPGFITPFHVLAEGLEQTYGPGAAQQRIGMFGTVLGTIDGSFGSTAGEPNVWWMFAVNQSMPVSAETGWGYAMNQYRVADGDDIDFVGMWGGQWGVASPYLGFFAQQSYNATVGQSLEIQLSGLDGFDDFGVRPTRALAGAEILKDPVSGTRVGATTPSGIIVDAQGKAELTFDAPGTYLLSAKRPIASASSPGGAVSDITRPFAVVTVTEETVNQPIAPFWDSFRGDTHNSGTTATQTPGTAQSGQAAWSHRVDTGSTALSPVKIGNYIYIAGGSTLFKFDATTTTAADRLVASASLAQPIGPAALLAAGSGKIFVPLGAGQVQAFDTSTLESLWLSESFDSSWRTYGALSYADGYLYAAAGRDRFMVESEGYFFCLDARTGEKVWTYSSTAAQAQRERGFYWSGAAHIETTAGNVALFAGDDGVLVSHRAGSAGAEGSAVIDTAQLPGGVRSSVLFVPSSSDADLAGFVYVSTRNGYVARVTVAADGSFTGQTRAAGLSGAGSTSTPVVYRNRVYVVSGELLEDGYVEVFNASTLERLRGVSLPGFSQSSPLLSTRGANTANGYEISLFVALNDARDDVVRIVDSERPDSNMRAESIFRPGGSFTLGSVSACENGRLYYVDGRGYFTAIAASNEQLPPQDDGTGNGTDGNEGNGDGSAGGNDDDDYLSEDTTRAAQGGPQTGDFTSALRWLLGVGIAAVAVITIASKLISDRKMEMLSKIVKYHNG